MRVHIAALLAMTLAAGCGGGGEWSPDSAERRYLSDWAGRIARSLVPPCDPSDLDEEGLRRLAAHCDSVPQRYVYLYARMSDSIQAMTAPEPECPRTQPRAADGQASPPDTAGQAPAPASADTASPPSPLPDPESGRQAP
jgi:hypothetical protein